MKKLKKLLSIVLVLTMAMSLAVAVSADDYTITITPASGETINNGEVYYAYKVFDVTTSGTAYSYTIDSTSPFFSTIQSLTEYFTLTLVSGTTYTVSPTDTLSNMSELPEAVISALKDVDLSSVTADGTGTYDGTSAVITLSEAGYYYVTTTVGSGVLVTNAAPTASVTDKNTTPSVDKEVYNAEGEPTDDSDDYDYDNSSWDDTSYAQLGDTVYYQTTIDNLTKITTLTLHDGLDSGLTLDTDSIKVYFIADGSDASSVVLNSTTEVTNSCTITTTTTTHTLDTGTFSCDFEVKLDDVLTAKASQITDDSIIVVTYSATVNADAAYYSDSNDNDTYISYGNSSYSTISTVQTYVYKLTIWKHNSSNENLAGVGFKLYYTGENGDTVYVNVAEDTTGVAGAYTVVASDPTKDSADNAIELITDSGGNIVVSGLDSDKTYYLVETTTPDGYNSLTGPVTVKIKTTGTVDYTVNGSSQVTDQTQVSIENLSGSVLPGTGGIGTTIFYVVGGVLILGAVILLITRKRMSEEDK